MRADHVRDVQERQPHFRRDVVGDGLRERVDRVLLPQPRLQPLVEPPGASIADMNTWWLCGSNRIRFSSWMSARMKSKSADPDIASMSPFNVAMEAWLRSISSATMAGSVSIGAGALSAGVPPRPSSGGPG